MTLFDDNPEIPSAGDAETDRNPPAESHREELGENAPPLLVHSPIDPSAPLAGDPITYAAESPHTAIPAFSAATAVFPEDLRISWYWPHLILFVFFTFASFLVVQTAMFIYYGPKQPLPKEQLEEYLLSKPQFIFGTNVLWYASVFLFLYVTLAVLRDAPFWSSLGWKKLSVRLSSTWGGPWSYFLGGCALAIFVGIASSHVKDTDKMPIRELFKNRENAVLLMCMAVFRCAARRGNRFSRIPLSPACADCLQRDAPFWRSAAGSDSHRYVQQRRDYRCAVWPDARRAARLDVERRRPFDPRRRDFHVCSRAHRHGTGEFSASPRIQLNDRGHNHHRNPRLY